ncbi:sugar ABC transporter permease [Paenibacillus sp. Soil787]|nr:sugar ABC transporter permease [Paenibacillus sp. Soil787]
MASKNHVKTEEYPQVTTKRLLKKVFSRDYQLYFLCLPALIYIILFDYVPMYGIQLAFKDFMISKGIWGSPWVGFKHFERFFESYQFMAVLKNTLGVSVYELVAGFPIPIILALLLNQVRSQRFKKIVQTVTYAPHFISVVVLSSMLIIFLSPSIGVVNNIITAFGGEKINFMARPDLWKSIFVWSGIWQNAGWGTIIYIAALSSISPELYEAAKVDGASKFQIIRHVDIPGISQTMVILFILGIGHVMNVGFQKAYLLQNALNIDASEVISTYVYKIGIEGNQFSYSTAIGLFSTVINIILLVSANRIAKKLSGSSLW